MKMYIAIAFAFATLILPGCLRWQGTEPTALAAGDLPDNNSKTEPEASANGSGKLSCQSNPIQTTPVDDAALSAIISDVAGKEKITGMVALVIVNHETVARGAFGIRNANQPETALTIDDKMHLGSCTKAITATLAGLLVDQGKLAWDDTIADRLPQIADKIAPEYLEVTLSQLLQHRGGVIANGAAWRNDGVGTIENRLEIIALGLGKFPQAREIGRFHYSNLGYAIIGAMIEAAGEDDYENLVRTMIFDPLGMHSAGFGPPRGEKPFDQPWGHMHQGEKVTPLDFDNPPSMSPAGGVHANLADWAKFISVHMPRETPEQPDFLSSETLDFLHTPANVPVPGGTERPYARGLAHRQRGIEIPRIAT